MRETAIVLASLAALAQFVGFGLVVVESQHTRRVSRRAKLRTDEIYEFSKPKVEGAKIDAKLDVLLLQQQMNAHWHWLQRVEQLTALNRVTYEDAQNVRIDPFAIGRIVVIRRPISIPAWSGPTALALAILLALAAALVGLYS